MMLDVQTIHEARRRIGPHVRHTPLDPSPALSDLLGFAAHLKVEGMQITGSFKPRISFNKLLSLPESVRRRGAVASTAGGHGIGLSYAGRELGVPITICLPHSADPRTVAVIERQGAKILRFPNVEEARRAAVSIAEREDLTFVSAYNDPVIIAGGGTVGLEIQADAPETDLVVVGMGGGGIAVGIAIAMKAANPKLQVWGVQPETTAVLAAWLEAGHPVPFAGGSSIADGLGAVIEEESITFPLAQDHVDRVLVVSDREIRAAMLWLLEEHQLVVEPSGAAPVAALLKARPPGFRAAVAVLTGRNIARDRYLKLMAEALVERGQQGRVG